MIVLNGDRHNPLTPADIAKLRSARPAGPAPQPAPGRSGSSGAPATAAWSWSLGRRSPSADQAKIYSGLGLHLTSEIQLILH